METARGMIDVVAVSTGKDIEEVPLLAVS